MLKPLTYQQLVKYAQCDNSLEQELLLNESSRTISPELKEALEQTILPNVADNSKNYLFSTLWTAISKSEHVMVGDLCFVGEPNEHGEVEIGYGTYDMFQGRGYMTEIVGGIIEWARFQPGLRSIIASTDKTNIASSRVLEKNGFDRVGETALQFSWKLTLNAESEQDVDKGNDQQDMDESAGTVRKEPNCPADDQQHRNDIQNVSHGVLFT